MKAFLNIMLVAVLATGLASCADQYTVRTEYGPSLDAYPPYRSYYYPTYGSPYYGASYYNYSSPPRCYYRNGHRYVKPHLRHRI